MRIPWNPNCRAGAPKRGACRKAASRLSGRGPRMEPARSAGSGDFGGVLGGARAGKRLLIPAARPTGASMRRRRYVHAFNEWTTRLWRRRLQMGIKVGNRPGGILPTAICCIPTLTEPPYTPSMYRGVGGRSREVWPARRARLPACRADLQPANPSRRNIHQAVHLVGLLGMAVTAELRCRIPVRRIWSIRAAHKERSLPGCLNAPNLAGPGSLAVLVMTGRAGDRGYAAAGGRQRDCKTVVPCELAAVGSGHGYLALA